MSIEPAAVTPAPHTVVLEKVKPARPAAWAIFLIAIASLLGTAGLVWTSFARGHEVEDARKTVTAVRHELEATSRQLDAVTEELRCRSRASADVQAALGHLVSVFSQAFEGAFAGDPTVRRAALADARAHLDDALQAQTEAAQACKSA